jgi:hypothetical protein
MTSCASAYNSCEEYELWDRDRGVLIAVVVLLVSDAVGAPLPADAIVWLAYAGAAIFGDPMPRVGIPAAGIDICETGAVAGRAARVGIDNACSLNNRVTGASMAVNPKHSMCSPVIV